MKCIIPGPNVKVLGRAIHSLAKLGDELYLEANPTELSFKTVNAAKTAYATFQFYVDFFSYFSPSREEKSKDPVKCQISMRSSLSVFRSPITLDRTVDSLQIQLHSDGEKLVFLMKYKKGFYKTINVPVIESETLQAHYVKDKAPNKLIVQPKIVCDILSNFHSNQHEITWKVTKNKLIVRNYSENETIYSGVRTEIKVEKGEFDDFHIENETEITFCMKELRAVLLFSDNVVLPLTVYFITSSKPIVFAVKGEVFEADIVVSTLTSSDCIDSQNSQGRDENNAASNKADELQDISNQNDELLCNLELDEPVLEDAENNQQSNNNTNQGDISNVKEKLKHVFQRCFDKEKFDVKKLPGYDVILAADSDSDSDKDTN